jgi:hypothetical protein
VGGSGGGSEGAGGGSGGKGVGSARVSDRIAKVLAAKKAGAAAGGQQEEWQQGTLGKRRASVSPGVGAAPAGAGAVVQGEGLDAAASAQPKRFSQRRAAAVAASKAAGEEGDAGEDGESVMQQQQQQQQAMEGGQRQQQQQQVGAEELQPGSPVFPGPTVGNARGNRSARRRPAGGGGWPALLGFT